MSTKEFAVFEALDLSPIKMKLMHVESGEGWSAMRADAVETEYRRFLFLMKKYPDSQASPTVDVDTFWHYHILDTMKYARDCKAVFGYFLHHYPYVSIGEGADDSEREDGGERMRAIYEAEFGAQSGAAAAWCASPSKQVEASAWCASPSKGVDLSAWCASPSKGVEASAWCASPSKLVEASAWCASPSKGVEATAWCAAPSKRVDASAWCASPSKQAGAATAWCASPSRKLESANAATAWCASPSKQLTVSKAVAAAWCASPARPGGTSAAEATAWCASPSKELALAA
jgi:hypothetical protein